MPRFGLRLDHVFPGTMEQGLALLAETLRYESVWIPEGGSADALTQLASLATATRTIGLAPGVIPIYFRTPTALAMSAASMARISQGRFILGLGVGHRENIEERHGTPFDRPFTRLRETVEILRRLLAAEQVDWNGRAYHLRGASLGLSDSPRVPVYIAALGLQMVELAGEIADGVVLNWASPAYLERALSALDRGARKAGRSVDDIDVTCYIRTAVADDPEAARNSMRRRVAFSASMPYYVNLFAAMGFQREAQASHEAWRRGDVEAAAAAIPDGMLEEVGVMGRPEHCRKEMERRRTLGVGLPIIAPIPVTGEADSLRRCVAAFRG